MTVHDFAQCLNQKGQCDMLLLDFCKAFDKVPHSHLFKKFLWYSRSSLDLGNEFSFNRSRQIILNNKQSNSCNILSGIPQGTVLAPLLFLIFINPLSPYIAMFQIKCDFYGDDVILHSYNYLL